MSLAVVLNKKQMKKVKENIIFIPHQDMIFHRPYALNLLYQYHSSVSEIVLIAKFCLGKFWYKIIVLKYSFKESSTQSEIRLAYLFKLQKCKFEKFRNIFQQQINLSWNVHMYKIHAKFIINKNGRCSCYLFSIT